MLLNISHHVHTHVTFGKNEGQYYTTRYCEHITPKKSCSKIYIVYKCIFFKTKNKTSRVLHDDSCLKHKWRIQRWVSSCPEWRFRRRYSTCWGFWRTVLRFWSKSNVGGVTLSLVAFSRSILHYSSSNVEHNSAHCTEICKRFLELESALWKVNYMTAKIDNVAMQNFLFSSN